MRILFAGTPAAAVPSLDALVDSDHEVVAVLTRPDAPVGRRRVLTPSPVKERARDHGIPVLEASRLRGGIIDEIAALSVDAVAVVAYGAIAGPKALAAARLGWFNLHFSLLPAHRGAAPVQRALMAGECSSGVTVFRIDEGMDTGDVLTRATMALPGPESTEDAGDVLARFAADGASVLVSAMDALASGAAELTPQAGEATHAEKISPDEARLDFRLSAAEVLARFRGVSPSPGAWALIGGKRTKLGGLSAAGAGARAAAGEIAADGDDVVIGTGTVPVRVRRIQPFGKPMMDASDFLRGRGAVRFDLEDEG